MSAIEWAPGLSLPQGEDDVLDYTFTFARWLAGDTLVSATVDARGLTATVGETTADTVKVRVADATANSQLMLRVVTASGQRAGFVTFFNPQQTACCA